ncbi:putative Ig domain-containing protein [Paenibacillus sp. sptzw28]|uniref:LamG-like jellyroll fold domain-containing protein n=1 Tax=Paenibacillus sp. sptzw28 TaxID=715179 RepID=UPI001C6EAF72|nr:LamG-like jellyroll fold domain-containing protein [Paenibacillus sp. sptzw28]QYR23074.1 putative Ig domain-containing protein [Paenibacillus sp. sptzw28]
MYLGNKKAAWTMRTLAVCLAAAMLLQLLVPAVNNRVFAANEDPQLESAQSEPAYGILDKIDFGNADSESAHNFRGEFTSVITGFMGENARVSEPRIPASDTGGFLTFSMKVDPYLQNYFTVKFSGNETMPPGARAQIVINGEQIGYFRGGDYGALFGGERAPNQFIYSTIVLPLESTRGKEIVEITINTTNPPGKVEQPSRGYYTGYSHTQAYIDVDDEVQGYKFKENQGPETVLQSGDTYEEIEARIEQLRQEPINTFNNLYNHLGNNPNNTLNIAKYTNQLRYYAMVLKQDISPMKTPEAKREALMRMFQAIDVHTKNYYGNTRLVLRGGHQGDWGGFHGELGEALYLAETLIFDEDVLGEEAYNDFLDQPFDTGTVEGEFSLASAGWNGESLTRRMAWERVLKANFDFARSRQSYITNQVFYTYEGAWKAHEGLRMVGSKFYEGKARSHQIVLEMFGVRPWLGEEVLVGPNGEELDLYHSLFAHDNSAVFTDDYVHIVGKGLAKSKLDEEGHVVRRNPYGEHYTNLTKAGLTRENHYVGIYGEVANYILDYFYKTLDQPGDEQLNDELLKQALHNFYARVWTRIQDLDDEGKRLIAMNATVDARNGGMPSRTPAYGARMLGYGTSYAYLEKHMADHEERYSGPEWERYWDYAKYTVGAVQQMKMDNRLMGDLSSRDFHLPETYEYIFKTRKDYARFNDVKAGVVIPQTDFDYYTEEEIAALGVNPEDYEQFAWIDVDNAFISMRDGNFRMFGALAWLNLGVSATGRLHIVTPKYVGTVQVAHNNQFQYTDYYIRPHDVDLFYQRSDPATKGFAPQSLAGEILPTAYQPGVGTVVRDNLEVDHPYSSLSDLRVARYGEYFILMNTTRAEYENERSFEVELPSDYTGNEIFDLVSKANIPVINGKVTIGPEKGMVLKLSSKFDPTPKPSHVDFAKAVEGNGFVDVIWKTTAGGKTYTIKRSEVEHGPYAVIAEGLTGSHYKDTDVVNGKVYYYKVAAVNEHGSGWESWRAKADLSDAGSKNLASPWQQDLIGTTKGSATINGDVITIQNVDGKGLGEGDDFNIYKRDINDSFHFVHQTAVGNSSISARIDQNSGALSGIMLREKLSENSRYLYFGADDQGNLVLQDRNRVSFVVWNGGKAVSPLNHGIKGYHINDYPYIKLLWHHNSQIAYAFVSKDGVDWEYVAKTESLFPYAYYTGLISTQEAAFSEVTVSEMPRESLIPFVEKEKDQITLHWTKPKQASWFNVYRTYDEEASLIDPVFKAGTTELEDGSPWEEVLTGTRAKPFQDVLRYGSVYYKVLAVHDDGSPQPFSATVSADADPISVVLEDAKSLPAYDYTKASFYLYHKELDRIKAEMMRPEFEEAQLIDEIYDAKKLLVSVRTLLTKIQMDPSMARASEKFWQNDNISEEQNAWYLFDENPDTIAHTRSKESWVDVDFGAGNEKVVDTFRYLPRRNATHRVNDTVFKGSKDGVNWTDLHRIKGVGVYEWYSVINPDRTPYRYIRIYDDHFGFVNFEEIEFLKIGIDKTLLAHLLDEAAAAQEAGIYTEESLQSVVQHAAAAAAVHDNPDATQEEIDIADSNLLAAFKGLKYIPGMPVLQSLADKTVIAENTLTFKVQAVNAVTDVVYGVNGLPEGASFDAAAQTFVWTPGKEQSGVHTVTFTATAGEMSSSKTIKITVKGQPVIGPDTTVELTAKKDFSYQVPASDPTGEQLVYSAANLPAGAAFNAATGVFSWKPGQADYGSHSVTFTVSNANYSVSQTVAFKVKLGILSAEGYTKGSYYLYLKEVARIEAEMAKPGADKAQLAAQLDQAGKSLVPVPLSLYAFEGNANNSYGSSASGGAVFGPPVYTEGKVGQAINLNGTDNYVKLPSTHALAGYNEITLATWVYWKGGNQWQRIFDFGNNTNQFMFLTPRSGNNTLRFAIKNGGGEQIVQTSQLAVNQWVHVAVTLGSGSAKLYVNGELKATNTNTTIKPSDFKPGVNYIGKSQFNDPLFNGMIDEFRVYNYVLNADEIKATMNNTANWIDKTLIPILLEEAAKVNAELYTEESVQALQAEVSNAQSVYNNAAANQAEIDAASAGLLAALKGLQWKDVTASADPAAPNGKNGWYTSSVTVTLSPAAIAEYSLDKGVTWAVYSANVTLDQEGTHPFMYRRSVEPGEAQTLEIKIDRSAPVVQITGESSYTVDQTVIITCSATDVVSSVYGTPCTAPLVQAKAYTLPAGQNTISVTAEDMAGHQTTVTHTFTVTVTFDSLKTVTNTFMQTTGYKGWETVAKSYHQKLDQAKAAASRGKIDAARSMMADYIKQVTDQTGKYFTQEQADILIRWAQIVI